MQGAIDCPSRLLPQVVVLLEDEGDQLVMLLPFQLHLPPEEHSQEARTAQVWVLRCDSLGKVVLQLWSRVSELQQVVGSCSLHQRLDLVCRHIAEETVVHLAPPLGTAVQTKSKAMYSLDWY